MSDNVINISYKHKAKQALERLIVKLSVYIRPDGIFLDLLPFVNKATNNVYFKVSDCNYIVDNGELSLKAILYTDGKDMFVCRKNDFSTNFKPLDLGAITGGSKK